MGYFEAQAFKVQTSYNYVAQEKSGLLLKATLVFCTNFYALFTDERDIVAQAIIMQSLMSTQDKVQIQ